MISILSFIKNKFAGSKVTRVSACVVCVELLTQETWFSHLEHPCSVEQILKYSLVFGVALVITIVIVCMLKQ